MVVKKSIGHALRSRIEPEKGSTARKNRQMPRSTALHNLMVLRAIVETPLCRLSDICREVDISRTAVMLHVDNMLTDGIISRRGARFYPSGLIDIDSHVQFEVALFISEKSHRDVILEVVRLPGIDLSSIAKKSRLSLATAKKIVARGAKLGLLQIVREGRSVCSMPTDLLHQLDKDNGTRAQELQRHLILYMQRLGLSPKVITSTARTTTIKLTIAGQSHKVSFKIDPFRQ